MKTLLYLLIIFFSLSGNAQVTSTQGLSLSLSNQELIQGEHALVGTISDPESFLSGKVVESDLYYKNLSGVHQCTSTGLYWGGDTLNISWSMPENSLIIGQTYITEIWVWVYETGNENPVDMFNHIDTVTVENFSIVTGVENEIVNEEPELVAYPNPTIGPVTIRGLKSDLDEEIFVYETAGKLVQRVQTYGKQEIQLDFSSLKRGMYLIQLPDGRHSRIIRN